MKRLILLAPMALLVAVVGCSSEPEEQTQVSKRVIAEQANVEMVEGATRTGEQIYQRHCSACHDAGPGHPGHDAGPGHPATLLLGQKYGAEKAVIKGRKDLNQVYVKAIVRGGLLEMPPFRPTEITDAELDVIAEFIIQP